MKDNPRDPMTGIGGGTGLMELTVSADALTDETFTVAADGPGLEKSSANPNALVLSSGHGAAAPLPDKPPTLLKIIHNLLRRKYKWLIPVALIVAVLGAVYGYRSKKPTYTATGIIRLRANIPRILYSTDQNGIMPMFDAFAESQVALLTSERVLELALQSAEWKSLAKPPAENTLQSLQYNLEASRRGGELIYVTFKDDNPHTAALATKAVIDSYVKIYGESDAETDSQRTQKLSDFRLDLTAKLKALNDQIEKVAHEFGSDSLDSMYQSKIVDLNRLEAELRTCQTLLALEDSKSAPDSATRPDAHDNRAPAITIAMLADTDTKMRAYLNQKLDVERRLTELQGRVGSNHYSVVQLRNQIDTIDANIQRHLKSVQKEIDAGRMLASSAAGSTLTLAQLRQREANLQTLYDRAKTETVALGRKDLQIKNLKTEALTLQDSLNQTNARIDALNVESAVSGRISIISTGELPTVPSKDKRLERAALGGAGGFVLVFGTVLAFAFLDRRINNLTDFQRGSTPQTPMLGLLPQLPHDLADLEQSKSAAFCVHHIRTRLETDPLAVRQVYSITSAASGDGKTSLVIALGLSFAGANSRTLMIDADVIGGGLTRRMNSVIRRKIGGILVTQGLISEIQLDRALNQSKAEDRYLGEVLVELGYIQDTDVVHALGLQEKSRVGLLDALDGKPLHECLARTGTNNLWILPLGAAEPHHMGQLSPKALRRVIADSRKSFDVILIDTGTILGNLEASIAAAASDDVIVAVGRGQDRSILDRALNQLRETGARVAGVVFNRADPLDVRDLENITTSRASSINQFNDDYTTSHGTLMRMGPLANAVASIESSPESALDSVSSKKDR